MHPTLRPLTLAMALLAPTMMLPAVAQATWPTDPAVNLPVCTAAGWQINPVAIPDGAGGMIIAWADSRFGASGDVAAQHLDPNGNALWAVDGIRVGALTGSAGAGQPFLVTDGAGGAIVAWTTSNASNSTQNVVAQRIDGTGAARWNGGVPVVLATDSLYIGGMASDGAGGAVCAWIDYSTSASYLQRAQRVDATGHVLWNAGGVPMTVSIPAYHVQFAGDGIGGIMSVWTAGGGPDVYAQRVDGTGAARWGPDGFAVCPQPQTKWRPGIASDGAGGAIVTWMDPTVTSQAYAQRIDASGARLWPVGGAPIASAATAIADTIVGDGHGGVFAILQNALNGTSLRAQHLDSSGQPLWTTSGAIVDSLPGFNSNPMLACDGTGGIVVVWSTWLTDYTNYFVSAQSMTAAGTRRWTSTGAAVSTAYGRKTNVSVLGDGQGGLTAIWADGRSDGTYYSPNDIYAQHVGYDGADGSAAVAPASAPGSLAFAPPAPCPARSGQAIALRYALPATAHVRLTVADIAGRRVRTLDDAVRAAGTQRMSWDGRGDAGNAVSPGLYFVRLETPGRDATAKVVVER